MPGVPRVPSRLTPSCSLRCSPESMVGLGSSCRSRSDDIWTDLSSYSAASVRRPRKRTLTDGVTTVTAISAARRWSSSLYFSGHLTSARQPFEASTSTSEWASQKTQRRNEPSYIGKWLCIKKSVQQRVRRARFLETAARYWQLSLVIMSSERV